MEKCLKTDDVLKMFPIPEIQQKYSGGWKKLKKKKGSKGADRILFLIYAAPRIPIQRCMPKASYGLQRS
jgi:hypothetical protein